MNMKLIFANESITLSHSKILLLIFFHDQIKICTKILLGVELKDVTHKQHLMNTQATDKTFLVLT